MKNIALTLLFTLCFLTLGHAEWMTDYNAAVDQARKENKLLLLDFTGSDWCPYCIKLENEVLSTPTFKTFAQKYVLVLVDFPNQKPQTDDVKKQNSDLQAKYKVDGYPTLVVIDPNTGKELHRVGGYSPGSGPDAVISQLQ